MKRIDTYKDNLDKLDRLREVDRRYQKRKRKLNKDLISKQNKAYNIKFKERIRANSKINYLIRKNKIKRQPCKRCGKSRAHAHHPNYKYPLKIIWLCSSHHKLEHLKYKQQKT